MKKINRTFELETVTCFHQPVSVKSIVSLSQSPGKNVCICFFDFSSKFCVQCGRLGYMCFVLECFVHCFCALAFV